MAGGWDEPQAFPQRPGRPFGGANAERLGHHFRDMRRLMERLQEEMDALEGR